MMSRRASRIVLLLLVLLPALALLPRMAAAKDVPPLTGRVVDLANIVPADEKARLESKLAQFEQQTSGTQVAVLTVDSLDGETIEDYANKVGRTWALGQKGKNNGALLLVARGDRQMRIDVGYGLEPVLTDINTKHIQTDVIIPYFKKDDYGGGIEAGVNAILATIQGKPFEPAPDAPQPSGVPRGVAGGGGFGFLVFLAFVLGPFLLNAIRSGSWVVYVVLLPVAFFLGLLVSLPAGLIAAGIWLVLFPILRALLPRQTGIRRGRRGGGGWFIGPGFGGGGGGGWSGGGGGGGFSGGGGSFGGGGSSSSW